MESRRGDKIAAHKKRMMVNGGKYETNTKNANNRAFFYRIYCRNGKAGKEEAKKTNKQRTERISSFLDEVSQVHGAETVV